jgi:tRNA-dihydrouridine synthase 1
MLSRSFMPPEYRTTLLAYSPMFHSRLWLENRKVPRDHFQPTRLEKENVERSVEEPWLDGNPAYDRPLFVQFCANDPNTLLEAAQTVAPYCDAVDLNLGCPQGIAKRGNYGAFLQEDPSLIYNLINKLHTGLSVPVTAKMRILETKEKTLEYAKTILSAGASIITVHGRQRHQKGHFAGIADWSAIKYLREHLPADTVIFANGNILQHEDIQRCLDATGADGVMAAEGNLNNPAIFAPPPTAEEDIREYWRGKNGKGGWRVDAVMRRYLDILYKYVLEQDPPVRKPLYLPSDPLDSEEETITPPVDKPDLETKDDTLDNGPLKKRRKRERKEQRRANVNVQTNRGPNFHPMQAHMFALLRTLVIKHTNVRNALSRCRGGDMEAFEAVLRLVETAVKGGIREYESIDLTEDVKNENPAPSEVFDDPENSEAARKRCERPWWVCQPYIRPLPKEAVEKGVLLVGKKDREKFEAMGITVPDQMNQHKGQKRTLEQVEQEVVNQSIQLQKDAAVSG